MPAPVSAPFVTGVVLAAGGSQRLGQPKQLLPFGDTTLLGHCLATARACGFDQLVVTLGARAADVRAAVDLAGVDVVENPEYGDGCASSLATALTVVDERATALVLLLGDQPGVTAMTVWALVTGRGDAPIAVCRYDDGRGHPFAFGRPMFGELAGLRGDKAVWKLLEARPAEVAEVRVAGTVPRDVDTWEDYEAVVPRAAVS